MKETPEDRFEDEDFVARLHNVDTCHAAFTEIINHFSRPLYWQIRRMVFDHEATNDLLQNTFMKAWDNIDNFRGDAKLSTWLYKIAINETLTYIAREKLRNQVPIDSDNDFLINNLEADRYFDGNELQVKLLKAINSLPEKQRLVFNMRYFDEMPYEQMSEVLGTSVGGLKASYHHALKKIEQFFSDND